MPNVGLKASKIISFNGGLKINPISNHKTLVAPLIALIFIGASCKPFHSSQRIPNELHLYHSRAEVLNCLGRPKYVGIPVGQGLVDLEDSAVVFSVDSPKSDKFKMPLDAQLDDYSMWDYKEPDITIYFSADGFVESVIRPISMLMEHTAGIHYGDPAEKVLKLGEPSRNVIHGSFQIIEFSNLGLKFRLRNGKVRGVKVGRPHKTSTPFRSLCSCNKREPSQKTSPEKQGGATSVD